jgi:hypothetical protein
MQWLAVACTAENEVLAWHDSLSILESACGGEFRAISRVYSVEEREASALRGNNLDFQLRSINPRTFNFIEYQRPDEIKLLSLLLQTKVNLTVELHMRIGHGYKRFASMVPWQQEAYRLKGEQARKVLAGHYSLDEVGMISDYAETMNTDLLTAANVVNAKHDNHAYLVRKLEQIRIKHQTAIRAANSKDAVVAIRASMEEDSFFSMLM